MTQFLPDEEVAGGERAGSGCDSDSGTGLPAIPALQAVSGPAAVATTELRLMVQHK